MFFLNEKEKKIIKTFHGKKKLFTEREITKRKAWKRTVYHYGWLVLVWDL